MKIRLHMILLATVLAAASCAKVDPEFRIDDKVHVREGGTRAPTAETRHVMLLYSAGFNSLSSYLTDDIENLRDNGYIPTGRRNDNVLLVFSHHLKRNLDYATKMSPVLFRLYKDSKGETVSDTLKVYPETTLSVSSETVTDLMTFIKKEFPAKSYGMVLSSHATGWLPAGKYAEDSRTRPTSVGQQQGAAGEDSYEMDIKKFANAFPYKMEYMLFDACLMGSVEVACQLRNATRFIGFSQTEVMADGYQYNKLADDLIGDREPNPEAVCRHYFEQYLYSGGGATVSLVNTAGIASLAEVCRGIWENHRSDLSRINSNSEIQEYFRYGKSWYYDLRDLVVFIGATAEETAAFDEALAECVTYEAHTKSFLGIPLKNCCGMSTYIQTMGESDLDEYYKTLDWNIATDYVK